MIDLHDYKYTIEKSYGGCVEFFGTSHHIGREGTILFYLNGDLVIEDINEPHRKKYEGHQLHPVELPQLNLRQYLLFSEIGVCGTNGTNAKLVNGKWIIN